MEVGGEASARFDLIRIAAWVTFDGLIPLGPNFIQIIGENVRSAAHNLLERYGCVVETAHDGAEAVFMTSRGGTRYTRTFMEGFIRPGLDLGNWASRAGLTALVAHPNVIASPHIGAQTNEAQTRAGEHIAGEVLAELKGERLQWKVV